MLAVACAFRQGYSLNEEGNGIEFSVAREEV
jgi:hypothetical protein